MNKYFLTLLGMIMIGFGSQSVFATEQTQDIKYVQPTLSNLSKTYWRINKFNSDDDLAIDNFMLINECEIYNDFIQNEFEWREIRDTTRDFIKANKKNFPVHYEFKQSLTLGEYDFDQKAFKIGHDARIDGIRLFQIPSLDVFKNICGTDKKIAGYPRFVLLELSRPLELDYVPYDEVKANRLINDRIAPFQNLSDEKRKRINFQELRDVVMIMNVRLFSHKSDQRTGQKYLAANMLGVLEEIYIYTDQSKQELMFYKNFRKKNDRRLEEYQRKIDTQTHSSIQE